MPTSQAQLLNPSPAYWGGKYSDITIKFSGHEIQCHKAVLATNSNYFRAAFEFPTKEPDDGTLELKEDNQDAVETVLKYIYSCRYEPQHAKSGECGYQVGIVQAADKYGLPILRDCAASALAKLLQTVDDHCEIQFVIDQANAPLGADLAQRIADAFEPGMLPAFAIAPHFHELIEHIIPLREKCFELFSTAITLSRVPLVVHCRCGRYSLVVHPQLSQHPPPDVDCCKACGRILDPKVRRVFNADRASAHKYVLISGVYGDDEARATQRDRGFMF